MLVQSPPPRRHLPVTESFVFPPNLKVECNDRLPGRNPIVRDSATPLPEMPNADDTFAHLAGAYRIRTSYVRLLQMRLCRKSRHRVRSDEVEMLAGSLANYSRQPRSCQHSTISQSPDPRLLIAPFRWSRQSPRANFLTASRRLPKTHQIDCRPRHPVAIEPGLRCQSPENGNIPGGGRRRSANRLAFGERGSLETVHQTAKACQL
jgi:hypothetical protein